MAIVAPVLVLALLGTGAVLLNRNVVGARSAAKALSPAPLPQPSSASPQPGCTWLPSTAGQVKDVGTPPQNPPRTGTALMTITTNRGVIEITMDVAKTPCAVASFDNAHDGTSKMSLVLQSIAVTYR